MSQNRNRIFRQNGEWYCIVAGRTFGPWACKQYAQAGLQVESRRNLKRRPVKIKLSDDTTVTLD